MREVADSASEHRVAPDSGEQRDALPARPRPTVWRCGRFNLQLAEPIVMGILNVTPDSFSDGGCFDDPLAAVAQAARLVGDGAAILDVGGESTRPGAAEVAVSEELCRVRPLVKRFAEEGVAVSIDTRHAEVAAACVDSGASIINDVSGFRDRAMVDVAAGCDAGLIVMHMLGDPRSMQTNPRYHDVVHEVGGYLIAQAAMLEAAGVQRERIAIDPGIGFGKTLEHNIELIQRLSELADLGYPLVVGASRKRFIGTLTGVEAAARRMGGSLAAALFSVRAGANVVRVHDVSATVEALKVWSALQAG